MMVIRIVLIIACVSVVFCDKCLEEIKSLRTKFSRDIENLAAKYENALLELRAKYNDQDSER